MNDNFGYIDIVLLAIVAGIIILRLRNVLGKGAEDSAIRAKKSVIVDAQFEDVKSSKVEENINTKEFKEVKEAEQFFDYQFQYLDRNFQDPNHIVMPIPRGGESTRKQNQLSVNTMRNPNAFEKDDERIKTIKFKY